MLTMMKSPDMQITQYSLGRLLTTFEPITLAQMADRGSDGPFGDEIRAAAGAAVPVLAELRAAYQVLVVAGQPLSHYRTLYFDTADLAMYRRHHAGAPDRYKVRAREYVNSQAAFLEVKHRIGERHTVKTRIPTGGGDHGAHRRRPHFLADTCPYPADELTPSLWNHYTRITLVSKQRAERVTLDLDVTYGRERRATRRCRGSSWPRSSTRACALNRLSPG